MRTLLLEHLNPQPKGTPMTNYLEAAAEVLKQVVGGNSTTYSTKVECAKVYALLAAIDKGLLPKEMAEDLYGQLRTDRTSR